MSGETSGTVLVKARKTHRCVACEHPIRTGTVHARWAWFEDGTAQTVRAHQMCSDLDLGLDDDNMYCFGGEIALDDFLTRFPEWRDSDIEWGVLLETYDFLDGWLRWWWLWRWWS